MSPFPPDDLDGDGARGQILERQSTPLTIQEIERRQKPRKPVRDGKGRVVEPAEPPQPDRVGVWLI